MNSGAIANSNLVRPQEHPSSDRQSDFAGARTVKGKEAPGYVAFTFDDGPVTTYTNAILDTLEEFHVPGAFFVVGRRIDGKSPASREGAALLKDMAKRGFLIGNHTTRHDNLSEVAPRTATRSISQNATLIEDLTGFSPQLFRPPFGADTRALQRWLKKHGYTTVRWNIDPLDFLRARRKTLRARVVSMILEKEGGVVVLHDSKPWTAEALPGILADLEDANCARLQRKQIPIIPVSLHYFLRESDGTSRKIPEAILSTTQRYHERLADHCQTED